MKFKIFIIDDVSKNIQLLGQTLQSENYSIAYSLTGVNVMEKIEINQPDLILLDVMMPDKDGFEVCKELKSNPKTKEIPIIFVTAKNEIDDIVRGFNLGAVDYITKPFNAKEIIVRVNNHLQLRQAKKELEDALAKVKQLSGLLPICSNCKKIRDDSGYWMQVESYIERHTDAEFSHSLCPACLEELYPEISKKLKK